MTKPYLALEGVSYVLPDGRTLFSQIHEQFDQRSTGLVGRNGSGKTVLARVLAGELHPTAGSCTGQASVRYLGQQLSPAPGATVASLAGVDEALAALERIESGSTASDDFEALADRWDIRQRLQEGLTRHRLDHLDAATPAAVLSGGEAMRVALMGAQLSDADFLILDEPSNHLDSLNRKLLIEQLQRWPRGLFVISHDRQLLETMERIVELSALGLHSYGGNYSFYAACKSQQRLRAAQQLEQAKLERHREERAMQEQRERQERRQARGNRQGHEANQAKILLGLQKDRSEVTTGKLRRLHLAAREQLTQRVLEAGQRVDASIDVVLHAPSVAPASQRRVVQLDDIELPFVSGPTRHLSLTLTGQQRMGIVGPNGCGKSTLLKVLAGHVPPLAGTCKVLDEALYLDQRLEVLDPDRPVLEQMLAANRVAPEGELRTRLAQLGLDSQRVLVPSGALSGGERLKAALACGLYADPPAQLLLLDEPSNHLDLPSVQALETLLAHYGGALVVVSHDEDFMNALRLTHRLRAAPDGWLLEGW
jgi:ATPase subunit of ABC transporter with duplicated ATPase domains